MAHESDVVSVTSEIELRQETSESGVSLVKVSLLK